MTFPPPCPAAHDATDADISLPFPLDAASRSIAGGPGWWSTAALFVSITRGPGWGSRRGKDGVGEVCRLTCEIWTA